MMRMARNGFVVGWLHVAADNSCCIQVERECHPNISYISYIYGVYIGILGYIPHLRQKEEGGYEVLVYTWYLLSCIEYDIYDTAVYRNTVLPGTHVRMGDL